MIQIKVGRLTLGEVLGPRLTTKTKVLCKCECGKEKAIRWGDVKYGKTKSCGCDCGNPTHRMTDSRTYRIWCNMKTRCTNPKCKAYPDYGGRGITVCARWDSFENFLEDVGEIPKGLSLDRIDNDKGYEPGNVRLADSSTQNNNSRRNIRVSLGNESHTLAEWCRILCLPYSTVNMRMRLGWSAEEAITWKNNESE